MPSSGKGVVSFHPEHPVERYLNPLDVRRSLGASQPFIEGSFSSF